MKAYYNQEKIASSLRNFFKKFSISKPLLKNLCYIILAMISAESVVTSDFSRKLKDYFFNLGLTIFNLCYYNEINFTLKFNFVLYDV